MPGTSTNTDKPMSCSLLTVRNLKVCFDTECGTVAGVDGVSFDVKRGETLCIVGESGCGKSVTALSIMRLIPSPPGKIVQGEILFDGDTLLDKSELYMRHVRGNTISMIYQEPMTCLNPVLTIGEQVIEAIMVHERSGRREAYEKAIDILRRVGIPSAQMRLEEYPHQLSGGMRQRVMIAMALACNPKLLIADEPTTALDVTIQAQILDLMRTLQRDLGTSIMLITHDLGVVSEMADNVVVMYAGKVAEIGSVVDIFKRPLHPYTVGLLRSIPRLDDDSGRLQVIQGTVPNPGEMPKGCRFHPRCLHAEDICRTKEPPSKVYESRHVNCWRPVGCTF